MVKETLIKSILTNSLTSKLSHKFQDLIMKVLGIVAIEAEVAVEEVVLMDSQEETVHGKVKELLLSNS